MARAVHSVVVQITANMAQMLNELATTNKKLGGFEAGLKRLQNQLIGTFGAYQVIGAIQSSVKTLAEFDKTITQVGVITGATGADFDRLEKSALRLGSSTQYTAKEIADLQLEFGRLGFSTREILQSTKATVDLATATGEGLARSAEIAGSTLRAFGLDASEMGRVTDVMAAALNNSALTLDSFADGIKYVSPVAAAVNVSLEETAAMMSVLADAGIKGTQAGTSLRRIFTMLTDTGKPLQQRLDELAQSGLTLAGANDEVGLYAQTALLVLSRYKPRIDELTVAYNEAIGATDEMARKMENNLATSITKVGTAWDGLILSFRNSSGVLKEAADNTANIITAFSNTGGLERAAMIFATLSGNTGMFEAFAKAGDALKKYNAELDKKQAAEDQLIEDAAIAMLKDYGQEIDRVKEALVGHNKEKEIYQRYLDLAKQSLITEANALTANTQAQAENNKAREEALKLAYEKSELQRGARIATLERQQNPYTRPGLEQMDRGTMETLDPFSAMAQSAANLVKQIEVLNEKQLENNKLIIDSRLQYAQSADVIGDSLARVIAREFELGDAIRIVSSTILDEAQKRIVAYIAEGKAKVFAQLGVGAIGLIIAGITAGFSITKGLLRQVGSNRSSRVDNDMRMEVYGELRGSGRDLIAVIRNGNRSNAITGG